MPIIINRLNYFFKSEIKWMNSNDRIDWYFQFENVAYNRLCKKGERIWISFKQHIDLMWSIYCMDLWLVQFFVLLSSNWPKRMHFKILVTFKFYYFFKFAIIAIFFMKLFYFNSSTFLASHIIMNVPIFCFAYENFHQQL